MDEVTFTLPHPCTISIYGSTGVGKSYLAFDIIKRRDELFSESIRDVTYCFSEFQTKFHELEAADENVKFTNDLLEIDKIKNGPHLVILDDLQMD